jgi:hypothetical protein
VTGDRIAYSGRPREFAKGIARSAALLPDDRQLEDEIESTSELRSVCDSISVARAGRAGGDALVTRRAPDRESSRPLDATFQPILHRAPLGSLWPGLKVRACGREDSAEEKR